MVKVEVGVVVGEIAGDEPREEGVCRRRSEDEREQSEEQGRERDADRRRHDQPERIVGVLVVDAVHDEVEPGAERVVGLPVEDGAMQPVLAERPDQEAGEEEPGDLEDVIAAVEPRPQTDDHDRDEDDRRDRWVNSREEVEEAALEEWRRRAQAIGSLLR